MKDSSLPGPQAPSGAESLHTLPEIAAATGIPLDDLKHYRREYALRIPIAGSDGARRYPEAAVETFRTIHREQSGQGNGGNGGNGGATVHGRRLLSLSAQRQAEAANGNTDDRGGDRAARVDEPRDAAAKGNEAPVAEPAAPLRTEGPAENETSTDAETVGPSEPVRDPGPPSAFEELSSALALLAPAPPGARPVETRREPDRPAAAGSAAGRRETGNRAAGRRDEAPRTNGATRPRTVDAAAPAPRGVRRPQARPATAPPAEAEALPTRSPGMPPRPPRRPTPPPQRPRPAETATDAGADAAARFLGLGSRAGDATTEPAAAPSVTPPKDDAALEERLFDADPADRERFGGDTAAPTPTAPTSTLSLPIREPRPTRPIYTLQQVHELTSIPYAKLSLFAARHFDDIPWVGERYSPAYTRQGLEVFCRLYAAENPDWDAPPLGPERGWDDLGGLAARITALESVQTALADVLEQAVEEFLRPWSGEAQWEV